MSEGAALLDEPKAETVQTEAVATATQAETANNAVTAVGEPAELDIDALLNEASTLAEAAEATEPADHAQTPQASENQATTEPPPIEAPVTEPPAESTEEPSTLTAESPPLSTQHSALSTESPAPSTDSPPVSTDSSASTPDAPAANPWADEVAQLENQWAQGNEGTVKSPATSSGGPATGDSAAKLTAAATPSAETEPTKQAAANGSARGKGRLRALAPVATVLFKGPVLALVIFDIPFARLSPRLKNLLGYIGIATTIVAAACWILAPRLLSMLE